MKNGSVVPSLSKVDGRRYLGHAGCTLGSLVSEENDGSGRDLALLERDVEAWQAVEALGGTLSEKDKFRRN